MSSDDPRDDATLPPTTVDYATQCAPTQPVDPAAPLPTTAPTVAAPPGYEILEELGRGGMGLVYKARHQRLNRIVALKMILAGGHASGADLTRFHAEAEAIARLRHPNIVQVFDVGEHQGLPYFSLEFCAGGSLDRKLKGTPMAPREAAKLIGKLAHAIEEAHQKGILHRDLKPANVLLGDDGTPKITDFGLAKTLDGPPGQTASGAVLGTPSYMSPEQAGGKTKDIGPATDIYALGATLYELLTGRPPFRAATPLDTLMQALANEPAPVRLLNPEVDRDLETICLKCLEKDPAHRYPSARILAEDLERYLAGDAISVRSVNVIERLARTLQRSQIDAGFGSWAAVSFWFGGIILGTQIALFPIIATRQSRYVISTVQITQFILMALVLWCYRSPNMLTLNAATRQLWSIWIGYLIGCNILALVSHSLFGFERMYDYVLYPYWSILSGMGYFVMGGSHWGWFYALGMAFFALGLALPYWPAAGPLSFGTLWAISCVIIGLRLRSSGEG